jgi:hypothetical protein
VFRLRHAVRARQGPDRGIYKLTTTTTSDSCDPPRYTGTATVGVFHKGSSLLLPRSNSAGFMTYTLDGAEGYVLRIPADGKTLHPCPDQPTSSLITQLTLTDADAARVEVSAYDDWQLDHACGPFGPTASCHTRQTLSYALVQRCESPCTITDELACQCPP